MVKLNKIYTRTGDDGSSGLVDGSRLPKGDALFAAIGDVDELNCVIGVALRAIESGTAMATQLSVIQNDLFDLGADLATPAGTGNDPFAPGEMALRIIVEQVTRLEDEIDEMNIALAPLTSFILPGGSAASAHLHVARSVARRAERSAVTAGGQREINPAALAYLNRLSDWLFVAARVANGNGADDVLWVPGRIAHRVSDAADLSARFRSVRDLSVALIAPLSDADASVQSMADASPAKWHLAHTTWFFETFLLRDHMAGYRLHDERYPYLFNSYYEAEGARHARAARGLLTRPTLAEVLEWRSAVDAAVIDAMPYLAQCAGELLTLGLAHEQQHQELLLTDLLHLFAQNPLGPVAYPAVGPNRSEAAPLAWIDGATGVFDIGDAGGGFAFDCEGPRHQVLLTPHQIASRPVSNAEWCAFIDDGGYADPRHWLADGWAWVQAEGIGAPLYWREGAQGREQFSLHGWRALDPAAPVCHISLYEADAYAAWAGARLPTEAEWESAAAGLDAAGGQQLDGIGLFTPQRSAATGLSQMFGTVWEWTGSAYRPYPGFRAAPGAVGEYNGKFMSGQFVLKGGSLATPRGHMRASYRNFFYPHQRWQFCGLRLARDV